ncbi:hypothetical protein GCM10023083_67060 [Streptomyces phyllanthi]
MVSPFSPVSERNGETIPGSHPARQRHPDKPVRANPTSQPEPTRTSPSTRRRACQSTPSPSTGRQPVKEYKE